MNRGYSRQLLASYRLQQQTADGLTVADVPFTNEDLADTRPRRRHRWLKAASRVTGLALFACLPAVVLVGMKLVGKPELSASEIIQMDGYSGRQSVPDPVTAEGLIGFKVSGQSGNIREISARNHAPVVQAIAPQIINEYFSVYPDTAVDVDTKIRMQVLKQWSNLRATPNIDGDIITALDRRESVTVLGQTEKWLRVETDNNQRGYMHRSVLGAN